MGQYYHYTSTNNARSIKNDLKLKKSLQTGVVILTKLDPKNYNRDEILRKIHGQNYDRFKFGNRADWVVIVDSSKLKSSKLRKKSNEIYEYSDDIPVQANDVIDKPRCIPATSGSSTWSALMDGEYLYHYTNSSGANAIKAAGFLKKSGQSGAFGVGVYMTDLKPTDFFRQDILKNNYGGISTAFQGRADFVVRVKKNSLNSSKLHKVSGAVRGTDRSIYVYDDEIAVSTADVYDKPRCYRAL